MYIYIYINIYIYISVSCPAHNLLHWARSNSLLSSKCRCLWEALPDCQVGFFCMCLFLSMCLCTLSLPIYTYTAVSSSRL